MASNKDFMTLTINVDSQNALEVSSHIYLTNTIYFIVFILRLRQQH